MAVNPLKHSKSLTHYQNPDDFPPGGFRTLIVARGPSLSNSSARKKYKKSKSIDVTKKLN